MSRTSSALAPIGMNQSLWRSAVIESARSMPCSSGARSGESASAEPTAASTCNHAPHAAARSATASSGSIAPRSVVPAVATIAIGLHPARASAASVSSSADISIRPRSSVGTPTTAPAPSPMTAAERRTLSCAADEATIRQPAWPSGSPSPRSGPRTASHARSRASSSASRLDAVPPLVSTPDPPGRPSMFASQRTRWSSTSVAAGAWSNESSDWFVAPIASSAATAGRSVGHCRCAAQRGSETWTPWARTVSRSSATSSASSTPSSGHGSMAAIVAASIAGSAPENGRSCARAAATASATSSAASRSWACDAGSAVRNPATSAAVAVMSPSTRSRPPCRRPGRSGRCPPPRR